MPIKAHDASRGLVMNSMTSAADHGDAAPQRHQHAAADHAADQFDVGGQSRHQFAATVALVEAGVESDQMRVQPFAHISDHALAQQRDEEEACRNAQRQDQRDHEQQQEGIVDIAAAATAEAFVDHGLDREREAQRCG